jgi:hypothetical protein
MFKNIKIFTILLAALTCTLTFAMPVSNIQVTNTELVGKTRISRTVFEYEYTVTLKNNGESLTAVEGIYSSGAVATTISDAQLTVGDIEANQTLTPTDTVKFRQDRRSRFNPNDLIWSFTGELNNLNLPPDPGAAGTTTIAGIDSDNDGIRDDVQRFIVINHSDDDNKKNALMEVATRTQKSLTSATKNEAIQTAEQIDRATECLIYSTSILIGEPEVSIQAILATQDLQNTLLSHVMNTEDRLKAYLAHESFLGGQTFSSAAMTQDSLKDSCSFTVN